MKEDISILIVNKITMLLAIGGTLLAIMKTIKDLAKTKAEKEIAVAKEQSAGQTAIAQVKAEQEVMKKLIEENRLDTEQVNHLVDQLEKNYNGLMQRFLDFFKPK